MVLYSLLSSFHFFSFQWFSWPPCYFLYYFVRQTVPLSNQSFRRSKKNIVRCHLHFNSVPHAPARRRGNLYPVQTRSGARRFVARFGSRECLALRLWQLILLRRPQPLRSRIIAVSTLDGHPSQVMLRLVLSKKNQTLNSKVKLTKFLKIQKIKTFRIICFFPCINKIFIR